MIALLVLENKPAANGLLSTHQCEIFYWNFDESFIKNDTSATITQTKLIGSALEEHFNSHLEASQTR